jgi:lysophospholipase L1-like esterase
VETVAQLDSSDFGTADGAAVRHRTGPIALLGASYVAAWTLAEVAGVPVVNLGIPGDQTHEYIARFEDDVIPLEPRAVVIWGIDNDIIRAPRGEALDVEPRVVRNLAFLVRLAKDNGIEPVLVTDLTLRPPRRWVEGLATIVGRLRGKQSYQSYINGHVLRVNASIRELARRARVQLLDLHSITSGPDQMRARAFAEADGSHLTPAGYRAITAYAVPRLEAWFAEPVTARAAETPIGRFHQPLRTARQAQQLAG